MNHEPEPVTCYGYTKSTPLDCTYRFDLNLTIQPRDEGSSVWCWKPNKQPSFVGTVINQKLRRGMQ